MQPTSPPLYGRIVTDMLTGQNRNFELAALLNKLKIPEVVEFKTNTIISKYAVHILVSFQPHGISFMSQSPNNSV